MKLRLTTATLALSLSLVAVASTVKAEIKLKMSHFVPTTIGLHTDFMEPWARELEACTNGEVSVEIHPAGSALGNIVQQFDQARAGVTDIAFGHTGFPAGRFPRSTLIELPFLVPDANAGSMAMWAVRDELQAEYPGVKLLALMAHTPGTMHTANPVNGLEDLKGLRVRTSNQSIAAVVEHFGGEPVGLPPGQVYEALQKGTVDGVAIDWNGLNVYKLHEVATQHLDAPMYTGGFFFVMNQRRYDSLPDNVRACIDANSGETLVNTFGPMWDSWQVPGRKIVDAGPPHVVVTATDEQLAKWKAELEPVTEALIQSVVDKGVPDAPSIVENMQAAIEAQK